MHLFKVELLTYNQWAWRTDYYLAQQMTFDINFEITYASHLNISVNSYVKQGELWSMAMRQVMLLHARDIYFWRNGGDIN